jgi:hypothetical protein
MDTVHSYISCKGDTIFFKRLFTLQAVRCQEIPNVVIPTDEHLKLYNKKLPKPEKYIAVAATKQSRRYREQRQQEDPNV